MTWKDRLWEAHPERRLTAEEVAEALGYSKDFIYRRTMSSADDPLPHHKIGGRLRFRAGDIRNWISAHAGINR